MIGDRRDRPLVALEHLDNDIGRVGKQGAAPAPRAERADRGQREQRGVDRQDRSLRRKIVGGGSGRRGHQDAVGDQFRHALVLVDQDPQPCRLMGLAKQRDLVDRMMQMHGAMHVGGAHQQRMDQRFLRRHQARTQVVRAELVHQKTDGAAMHAVNRLACAHVPMQRLQHQPVAAERHQDVGGVRIVIAIESHKLGQRRLRLRACARHEGDPVISLGAVHQIASSCRRQVQLAPRSSIRPWPCLSRSPGVAFGPRLWRALISSPSPHCDQRRSAAILH